MPSASRLCEPAPVSGLIYLLGSYRIATAPEPNSSRPTSFQSTRLRVLDTTYFLAASIVRPKGSIQSGLASVRADGRHAASIMSYVTRPERRGSAWLRFSTA
jgi:hypothetical protein